MIHGRDDSPPLSSPPQISEEISDRNSLNTSNQWFFYWKTSAHLWESQLSHHAGPWVNVPIHWGLHCEDGEEIDFGQNRPETDLARLATLCEQLHKELLFFLPVTPVPIFANGGVPRLLARLQARDQSGIAHAYRDGEGGVNTFPSFFDQRIFAAFQHYTRRLQQHFSQAKVVASVAGLLGGGMEQVGERESFTSYSEDSSQAFDRGLGRFIKAHNTSGMSFSGPQEEWEIKHLYLQMTQHLYLETAKEALQNYWVGALDCCFLGGGPRDIFDRCPLHGQHSTAPPPGQYAQQITQALTYNKIPTAALLHEPSRTPGLTAFLSQAVPPSVVKAHLDPEWDGEEAGPQYDMLCCFEIYERPWRYSCQAPSWHRVGLKQYLDQAYGGLYRVNNNLHQFPSGEGAASDWAHCWLGAEMDGPKVKEMLKAFLNGVSFIVDIAGMDPQAARVLEGFILQNSLEEEVVKYQTHIRRVVLGRGQLLLFDGGPLQQERPHIRDSFWAKVLSIFPFSLQSIELDDGVIAVWQKRPPIPNELNFEQIRRVILYNPTDYKKRAQILARPNFRLLRYSDTSQATVASANGGVEVALNADGHVAIDFGMIE